MQPDTNGTWGHKTWKPLQKGTQTLSAAYKGKLWGSEREYKWLYHGNARTDVQWMSENFLNRVYKRFISTQPVSLFLTLCRAWKTLYTDQSQRSNRTDVGTEPTNIYFLSPTTPPTSQHTRELIQSYYTHNRSFWFISSNIWQSSERQPLLCELGIK